MIVTRVLIWGLCEGGGKLYAGSLKIFAVELGALLLCCLEPYCYFVSKHRVFLPVGYGMNNKKVTEAKNWAVNI